MKKLISILLAVSALALSTSAFAAADAIDGKVFREGDVIEFVADADNFTLISMQDEDNIQYVDETTNGTISFKVRDLAEGDYTLVIKSGDNKLTYNYKVVDFDLVAPEGGYLVGLNADKKEAFYAAFATVKGGTFTEAGVTGVSFKFNGTPVNGAIGADVLDAATGELGGAKVAVYGITMAGVEDASQITAEAVEVE